MADEHPNLALLERVDLENLAGCAELFAEGVVWHFFNPRLPELHGDHVGPSGLQAFFEQLRAATGGHFEVEHVSASAMGDELVVTHTRNRLVFQGVPIETDAVVVWRIVDGRIAEVWDIPSLHAVQVGDLPRE